MVSSDAREAASAHVTTSTRKVRVIVVHPDERIEQVVARRPGAVPSFNRTLRIALAMRGGVSLAVWIGGAVAELDLLRRIRLYDDGVETLALVPETPATPITPSVLARLQAYAEMLDATGYDRVEFDLLAGASAGGLNAVVYAVAQRAGTGLDRLLDTWGQGRRFLGAPAPARVAPHPRAHAGRGLLPRPHLRGAPRDLRHRRSPSRPGVRLHERRSVRDRHRRGRRVRGGCERGSRPLPLRRQRRQPVRQPHPEPTRRARRDPSHGRPREPLAPRARRAVDVIASRGVRAR